MAPPVRGRDDAEDATIDDAGDAEGNAKPPRGWTTPVKAPRLEKSATAPPMRGAPTVSTLRAFASREDDLMNTPGSTSANASSKRGRAELDEANVSARVIPASCAASLLVTLQLQL